MAARRLILLPCRLRSLQIISPLFSCSKGTNHSESYSVVASACLYRPSCSVRAHIDTFGGEPPGCSGTQKFLSFYYTCAAAPPSPPPPSPR